MIFVAKSSLALFALQRFDVDGDHVQLRAVMADGKLAHPERRCLLEPFDGPDMCRRTAGAE